MKSLNYGRYFIALVWVVNGLFCKIMDLVPRHQLIVGRILGEENAGVFTKLIGGGELLVAFWVLIGFRSRVCAVFQIAIVMTMNLIEFTFAPDLLLFGKVNLAIAVLFSIFIYVDEFKFKTT